MSANEEENERNSFRMSAAQNKGDGELGRPPSYSSSEPHDLAPSPFAQQGVQDVEAVAITWSKGSLIAVFIKYIEILWSCDYPPDG